MSIEPRGQAKPAEHFVISATGLHLRVDFIAERVDGSALMEQTISLEERVTD